MGADRVDKRGAGDCYEEDFEAGHPPKRQRIHSPIPWHLNDVYLKQLTAAELLAEGISHLASANMGDLSNPIHPIFSRLHVSEHVAPALRLATHFIHNLHFLTFYHALLTQPWEFLPELSEKLRGPCYTFRLPAQPASAEALSGVRNFLQFSTSMIDIEFSPQCPEYAWGICVRNINTPASFPFKGSSSIVYINNDLLINISNPLLAPSQRLCFSFLLANTLAHEITHALYMARQPLPAQEIDPSRDPRTFDYEAYFADQRQAELGHAWESLVLGGRSHVIGGAKDARFGMFLEKWPATDDKYVEVPCSPKIAFQGNKLHMPPPTTVVVKARGPAKKWTTVYGIPIRVMNEWFTTRFWDHRVAREGLAAMRWEKRLGVRKRNWDWKEEHGIGIASDDSSMLRWPDANGVVRLHQPRIPTPEEESISYETESSAMSL